MRNRYNDAYTQFLLLLGQLAYGNSTCDSILPPRLTAARVQKEICLVKGPESFPIGISMLIAPRKPKLFVCTCQIGTFVLAMLVSHLFEHFSNAAGAEGASEMV
jgi:hypothetical protein